MKKLLFLLLMAVALIGSALSGNNWDIPAVKPDTVSFGVLLSAERICEICEVYQFYGRFQYEKINYAQTATYKNLFKNKEAFPLRGA